MKSTGLSDFGWKSNPRFEEGLDTMIAEIPFAQLTIVGRMWMNFLFYRRLVERLKFVNYVKLNPQIEQTQITNPIFIVGLPRTGSTLLFNLLGLDNDVHTLKLWELIYPVPHPYDPLTEAQRIRLLTAATVFQKTFSPRLNKIHYIHPTLPEEETLWFSQMNWFPGLTIGTLTKKVQEWFLKQEDENGDNALPMYQDFRNLLRMRQMEKGAGRWLLKGVLIHQHVLPSLLRIFPDAKIIYLRRDPCAVIASAASLETEMGHHFQRFNLKNYGAQRVPMLVSLEQSTKKFRESLPKEKENAHFFDLQYDTLVKDPIQAVERIYQHFGFEKSDKFLESMRQYLKSNPQHKHGKHHYHLKKFGLTDAEVREAFSAVYS